MKGFTVNTEGKLAAISKLPTGCVSEGHLHRAALGMGGGVCAAAGTSGRCKDLHSAHLMFFGLLLGMG